MREKASLMFEANEVNHKCDNILIISVHISLQSGTTFIWIYWPSFNAALAPPGANQHRTVINTYYALTSCTVTSFAISSLVDENGRFHMVSINVNITVTITHSLPYSISHSLTDCDAHSFTTPSDISLTHSDTQSLTHLFSQSINQIINH